MIAKVSHWWQALQSSFWFLPALIVLGAVGLASGLISVDASVELHFDKRWPILFGAGAAGARGLLSAVASSMITVAGVVFSITIVALSLTSSQYTSRVLRNFMRDRVNQVVLGVFVGIFAYCLVVLRTIRGGDEGAFVPSLAVIGAMALAFVGIAFLIYFIHHISLSIQASSIIAAVAEETIAAIDHLFPKRLGEHANEDVEHQAAGSLASQDWSVLRARKTGYIESVTEEALLEFARKHKTIVRLERGIGEFVVEDTPLASMAGRNDPDEEMVAELNGIFVISRQRSLQQDAGFGIRQIVDVALKALSPGLNDTTTAVMCVDYLGSILARLAVRGIPTSHRMDGGELRIIARGQTFESLLAEAFDQIRQNAGGNVAILKLLIQTLETIAGQTSDARRRQAIRHQADLITFIAKRTITTPHDLAGVEEASKHLSMIL